MTIGTNQIDLTYGYITKEEIERAYKEYLKLQIELSLWESLKELPK